MTPAKVVRLELHGAPWREDDRAWFESRPSRSHRMRMAFPDEFDAPPAPEAHVLVTIVRQVRPGERWRQSFWLHRNLWPAPEAESVAHALFEVAVGREPMPKCGKDLGALIEKYTAKNESGSVQ
jgi:hypothetical protein